MNFASAVTTNSEWMEVVAHLTGQIDAQTNGARADLALLFAHPRYRSRIDDIARTLRRNLRIEQLVGCSGAGVIGVRQEIEDEPAVSLLTAELPGVSVTPFRITQEEVEEATGPGYWHYQLEVETDPEPNFLLFADPFSIGATQLLGHLSEAYPGRPIIGGLASGGQQPGEMFLTLNEEVMDRGALGVALAGNVRLEPVVSQGCRPIGEPLVVTKADRNLLHELAGRPPVALLRELLPTLSARDRELAKQALFFGRVINEYQEDYGRGDFLIRNLIGQDPATGALAVGDLVQTGQTVQFQVRDGASADEDLRQLLTQTQRELAGHTVAGAVLFSCLGRGVGMYGAPNHDLDRLHDAFGNIPTAGFFCNGEIGPIGARSFVHGFTSVIGLFSAA